MFIKFINPSDFYRDTPVEIVKVAKKRILGGDARQFYKRATCFDYEEIVKLARPGEVLIHVIALGCDEFYGPNRNGDAFTKDACRVYHKTFVKHARWFRNHHHDDPKKSYGVVKASAFNEVDGRIELIVVLNATKEAAARNKGLLASKELELLEAGKDLPVSMACKVAYDVCSGCGNRAKSRADYCDEDMCKYGGLKHNMGRTFEDGHILRAFNPEPTFFDISYVNVPADRTAYTLGVIKTASPSWLLPGKGEEDIYRQLLTLDKLAYLERNLEDDDELIAAYSPREYRLTEVLPAIQYKEPYEVTAILTKYGILLPVEDFLRVFIDDKGVSEEDITKIGRAVRSYLPEVFGHLAGQADIEQLLQDNIFYPGQIDYDTIIKQGAVDILVKVSAEKGLLNVDPLDITKEASRPAPVIQDPKYLQIAETYGLYQLASLATWHNSDNTVIKRAIYLNRAY